MSENKTAIDDNYIKFVQQVAAAKLVWGLKSKQGWANSHSRDSEDVGVIPFWSDKALAKSCARDDWKGYLPVAIPLAEFLESWCVEMYDNIVIAGVNWDANMLGYEAYALKLALDILEQLKADQTDIKFVNYESIDAFIAEIQESLSNVQIEN